jgi:hypothetical protein
MFNSPAWQKILKKVYGIHAEERHGILMFRTHRGLEMNIVGDYIGKTNQNQTLPTNTCTIRLDYNPNHPDFQAAFETYRLATTQTFEELLKNSIHQKTRNMINKASKQNLQTRMEHSADALNDYYPIYVRTMLRIGAIPHSKKLFREVLANLDAKIFLTSHKSSSHKDKTLAGILTLYDPKNHRLHIWSNGQSKAARPLSANMACYAAVLQHACENPRIDEVDFGNTEPNSSLAFFKSRFGAKQIPVWTNAKTNSQASSKLPAKILSLLSVPCVSMASTLLFRYVR